jgi:hypothetical protein
VHDSATGAAGREIQGKQIRPGTKIEECSPNNRLRISVAGKTVWIDAFNVVASEPGEIQSPGEKKPAAGLERASIDYRRVYIVNETGSELVGFYASNSRVNSWAHDVLGNNVLPMGGRVGINIDDSTGSCMFDLKAVLKNGRVITRQNVNVCTSREVKMR